MTKNNLRRILADVCGSTAIDLEATARLLDSPWNRAASVAATLALVALYKRTSWGRGRWYQSYWANAASAALLPEQLCLMAQLLRDLKEGIEPSSGYRWAANEDIRGAAH